MPNIAVEPTIPAILPVSFNQMSVDELRRQGYAVVTFTPEELRGASPNHVCDLMVERGWDAIACLATEPEEMDEEDFLEPELPEDRN